jgi:uncharacterized protein
LTKTHLAWEEKMESFKNPDRAELKQILLDTNTIAVVGISNKENRPSNRVSLYMQEQGYQIIPVNPVIDEVFGIKAFDSISNLSEQPDLVCIFRKSEEALAVVEQAIKLGCKVVWMQDHVVNQLAAQKALSAGIKVVMNDCMLRQHMNLIGVK